eukprot:g16211.t1
MTRFAARLGLAEKLDTQCSDLSGGMKRRMWTLCALMQPRDTLILLDEPTSGLDPQSRRDFWLLLDEVCREENRACVFSTHYLEEADVLAEEKVILSHGTVVAAGTSADMKKKFGLGFWITLQYDESVSSQRTSTSAGEAAAGETPGESRSSSRVSASVSDRAQLLSAAGAHFVRKRLPPNSSVQFVTKTDAPGRVLQCLVPFNSAELIESILDDLAMNGAKFGLDKRVTVQKTTLEEVFQRVGEKGTQEEKECSMRMSMLEDSEIRFPKSSQLVSQLDTVHEGQKYLENPRNGENVDSTPLLSSEVGHYAGSDDYDTMPATVPERRFAFCAQVKAVFRFRLQGEFRGVLINCLICVAFLWVLAATTARSGMHVLRDNEGLLAPLFLLLGAFGASQMLYGARLREEHEEGRLQHLLIHGVSQTAYTLGTFLFYLLPSMLVLRFCSTCYYSENVALPGRVALALPSCFDDFYPMFEQ